MWKFSKHALRRLEEHGYSQDLILMVLREEIQAIVLPSPREESVDLYFCKIESRYLLIVADKNSTTVITARPMRKKEKLGFIEEMENE
jgi:hypothetical protein